MDRFRERLAASLNSLPTVNTASATTQSLLSEGQRRLAPSLDWLQRNLSRALSPTASNSNSSLDSTSTATSSSPSPVPSPPEPPLDDIEYVLVYHDPIYSTTSRKRAPQSSHTVPLLPPPVSTPYQYATPIARVTPYLTPPGLYAHSKNFTVTVNDVDIPVISNTSYDYVHFGHCQPNSGSVVNIKISLVHQEEQITTYRISPRKLGLEGHIEGATPGALQFTITKPEYIIVKINSYKEILILCDPAEMDIPPPHGDGVFNVLDPQFGADNTGKEYSTRAFQNALGAASKSVFDRFPPSDPHDREATDKLPVQAIVYIPRGIYLVQNLLLPSHTAMYLESGAVIRFSGIHADYHPHWHNLTQGRDITRWLSTLPPTTCSSSSTLPTYQTKNVTIYGRGTIDGVGHTSTTSVNPRIGNNILAPISCSTFTVKGIIIRDSGSRAMTPIRCKGVVIDHVKILNRMDMGENDCFDIIESQNVTITNSIGVALDDPFSVETWADQTDIARGLLGGDSEIERGETPSPPHSQQARDITFQNCLAWTRSWGFKIGPGIHQDISNITISHCIVYDAAIALGIHHRYGTGLTSHILFDSCHVEKASSSLPAVGGGGKTWFSVIVEEIGGYGVGGVEDIRVVGGWVWERGKGRVEVKGVEVGKGKGRGQGVVRGIVWRNVRLGEKEGEMAAGLEEIGVVERCMVGAEEVDVLVVEEEDENQEDEGEELGEVVERERLDVDA